MQPPSSSSIMHLSIIISQSCSVHPTFKLVIANRVPAALWSVYACAARTSMGCMWPTDVKCHLISWFGCLRILPSCRVIMAINSMHVAARWLDRFHGFPARPCCTTVLQLKPTCVCVSIILRCECVVGWMMF